MYHIAICDDDAGFRRKIKLLFERAGMHEREVRYYEYASGEELHMHLAEHIPYDLLILDMEMGEMDGHAAARLFRKAYPSAVLVFCTGKVAPSPESFKFTPYRYLMKQFTDAKMIGELREVMQRLQEEREYPELIGRKEAEYISVSAKDILYISNRKNGSTLYVYREGRTEEYLSNKKLKEHYEELWRHGFEYAHNSYIVNLAHVKKLRRTELVLADGAVLSISRSKAKKFQEAFMDRVGGKY